MYVERLIDKDIKTVFEVLADHEGSSQFRGVENATLLEPGEQEKNGAGALRQIDLGTVKFVERITVFDRPHRLDYLIEQSGMRWYILANYRDCRIWPEAWVAFAHRGKKVNVSYSLGTVRYVEPDPDDPASQSSDPDIFDSRAAALAHIEQMRSA